MAASRLLAVVVVLLVSCGGASTGGPPIETAAPAEAPSPASRPVRAAPVGYLTRLKRRHPRRFGQFKLGAFDGVLRQLKIYPAGRRAVLGEVLVILTGIDVVLDRVVLRGAAIHLEGTAAEYDDVAEVNRGLMRSKLFVDEFLLGANLTQAAGGKKEVYFRMRMKLNRKHLGLK